MHILVQIQIQFIGLLLLRFKLRNFRFPANLSPSPLWKNRLYHALCINRRATNVKLTVYRTIHRILVHYHEWLVYLISFKSLTSLITIAEQVKWYFINILIHFSIKITTCCLWLSIVFNRHWPNFAHKKR